jgi:hypothetical protein
MIPGPFIEEHQRLAPGVDVRSGASWDYLTIHIPVASSESSGVNVVLFLGGCTSAEISAIRMLAEERTIPLLRI